LSNTGLYDQMSKYRLKWACD